MRRVLRMQRYGCKAVIVCFTTTPLIAANRNKELPVLR